MSSPMLIPVIYKFFKSFFFPDTAYEIIVKKLKMENANEVLQFAVKNKFLHTEPHHVYETMQTETGNIHLKNSEIKNLISLIINHGANPYTQINHKSAIVLADETKQCGHLTEKICPSHSGRDENCAHYSYTVPDVGPLFFHPCDQSLAALIIEIYNSEFP